MHDGRRRVVAAAGAAAQAIGIRPGMPLANAQALVPALGISEAKPDADAATLAQLAAWCLRYAPLVAADGPDGIWIDATGCTHLVGGDEVLLTDLVSRLKRAGFAARAAVAGTPGIAHAVARYSGKLIAVVPSDGIKGTLEPLMDRLGPPHQPLRCGERLSHRAHRVRRARAIGTARASIGAARREVLADHPTAAGASFDATTAGHGDRTAA